MASPTVYSLSYDFTSFQTASPSTPLPADKHEIEYNNIATTLNEIISNLNLLQKSDGTIANGVVGVDALSTELTIGLRSPVSWSNGADYTVNDTVIEANALYRCDVAHTSGVFAADLASLYWILVADYDTFLTDASTAKDAAELAQTGAELAQAGAETAFDEFDDIYLGSKAMDPVLDNDGDALVTGALYWSTSSNEMKVYSGSAWGPATAATNLPVFVYTATGGETSVSGADDNTAILSYTVGKIQVYINGVNETQNVVATTGTSITGITALSASDVVEIYAFSSVAVLEDIASHSTATPTKTDYLLFQDVSDSGLDRRATICDIMLIDGVITAATEGVITAADEILFSDESDGNSTKKDTVQGLMDLVSGIPSGAVTVFAGAVAPSGWLLCYGQDINRVSYASLFTAIGTTFGAGDGSTTFALPDMRGRTVAGQDNMGGTSADRLTGLSGGVDGDSLGATGGDESHVLIESQLPAHTHDDGTLATSSSGNHTHDATQPSQGGGSNTGFATNTQGTSSTVTTDSAGAHTHNITGDTGSVGSDAAHNNVQPTIVLNYIIKT